jgi:formate hydrogenlyase subunit 6/NADH:ubiquinone oxidoreductase subunit I
VPQHALLTVLISSPLKALGKIEKNIQRVSRLMNSAAFFCGMCEEACPVDAIELTSLLDLTGKSREEMIFDKEKLLSVYDMTKDAEPMKSTGLGGTL